MYQYPEIEREHDEELSGKPIDVELLTAGQPPRGIRSP
jgi:hypothetical protein